MSSFSQEAVSAPAHPITREQVQELLQMTNAVGRMKAAMHTLSLQQRAVPPYSFMPDAFYSEFEADFAKLDWVALSTPIYRKYLSEEDATKAIAFYKTDAGQHALKASMAAATEMMQLGAEQGRIIGARLGQKYNKEFQENIRKAQQQSSAAASK